MHGVETRDFERSLSSSLLIHPRKASQVSRDQDPSNIVKPGLPLVRPLIGGCTDKTCRQRVGTYACIRFVDGIAGSSRVNHDDGEGSVETAHCARPARSSWVGKHTAVETHSGWRGEWSQRDGGGGEGDSEGHEKSVKERGGRRCRARVAGTTWLSSMRCDANSPRMYTTLGIYGITLPADTLRSTFSVFIIISRADTARVE